MHPSRDGASVHSGWVADPDPRYRSAHFEYLDTGAIVITQAFQVITLSPRQVAELQAFYEQAKQWI